MGDRSDSPSRQVAWDESKNEVVVGNTMPSSTGATKDMLAHIARSDVVRKGAAPSSSSRHVSPGTAKGRDVSPGARPLSAASGPPLSVTHAGTASISETNNPLVDRLINELRRLLKFQQKETRVARQQNAEMNKLLFERNEFVKVTIASLKREEYNSGMLLEEVRRLKQIVDGQLDGRNSSARKVRRKKVDTTFKVGPDEVDGAERGEPSSLVIEQDILSPQKGEQPDVEQEVEEEKETDDEFEHLRLEIIRLHQEATKSELLMRVKDEQAAVLQERIDALEASGLTLSRRTYGGRRGAFTPGMGGSAEEWLVRNPQEEAQRRAEAAERGEPLAPEERLMFLAVKLKSLVREARGDTQEDDPEMLEPETYAAQLSSLLLADDGIEGSETSSGRLRRGPDSATLALLESKDAELAQLRSRIEAYEANSTSEQSERAAYLALQEEAAELRAQNALLVAEDERKSGEIEQLYQDILAMDQDLAERKKDIESIAESMVALTAKLEEEIVRSDGLSANLTQQIALLGDANAHIARLNETLQQERTDANAAAALAASTIVQHLTTIDEKTKNILALQEEAQRTYEANTFTLAEKKREFDKAVAFYTGEVTTRDTRIASLLEQIDEWEKRMSLWEIIKGYEAENIELRASLADYQERYRMRRERLGMLAEDGLFLSLLFIERDKFAVKCSNLDDAMAVVSELMEKNANLYRTMAKERIDFADAKEAMSVDYAAKLAAMTADNNAHSRKQVAAHTTDVTVLKGLLSLLEQDAQNEAFKAKNTIKKEQDKIESLQQTIEELDRILFDKDVLLLRVRSENASYRAGELDLRVKTKVAARALKLVMAEDPSNDARAPRQRLKLVEEALVKAEARASMWERLAAGYEARAQSTHSVAFEMDSNILGGLEYAYGSIFNASVRERIFSLRAVAIVSSRTISAYAIDALHAWGEQHGMTERDEDKALRSVQLSWPALESMVDVQVFCDMVNAEQGTGDERADEMERIEKREEEMRRRLFVLFGPGRVSLPEMRAVHDLRVMLDLSTQQIEEVLASMQVPSLTLPMLAERAANALLDEYEVRSSAILRRDFDAVMAELDGPGKTFQSQQFLVHCKTLHQEVHEAARLRQKYAELKLVFNTTKLQAAIAESKVHPSISKRHIHPADGLPVEACRACMRDPDSAPDEATRRMEKRMAVCRDALQKELARLVTRGGLSVGRAVNIVVDTQAVSSSSSSISPPRGRSSIRDDGDRSREPSVDAPRGSSVAPATRPSSNAANTSDGVLHRIDENLESIELQLAQFGGEWDKARLVFVKLLRNKVQDELHLRAEQRRLSARLREADIEASEILALAEEASVAWGREEDGSSMVSRLIYETQQRLVESNERIRSTLVIVSQLRTKEVKQLQESMFALEDHIEALNAPERLDTSAYPPLTFAPNSFTGEEEALSLSVLQAELAEIRTLDLTLDRLENVAEIIEDLLLQQTHRVGETLDGLKETLQRLDVLDVQALPDHHMMKVTVNWAPHSFPVLSAFAEQQEQEERESILSQHHSQSLLQQNSYQNLSQTLAVGSVASVGTMGSIMSESPQAQQVVVGGGGQSSAVSRVLGGSLDGDDASVHSFSIKPPTVPDRGSTPGLRKPRSSKVVPTELEESYSRTTSHLVEDISTLKMEMQGIHTKMSKTLEDHEEAIQTARIATKSAVETAQAAKIASLAAKEATDLACQLHDEQSHRSCTLS